MAVFLDILSWLFIGAGAILSLIGAVGMLRLPDIFARCHGAGIIDTAGMGLILTGCMFQAGLSLVTVKLILIVVFILFTSPVTTHALARAALHGGVAPLTRKPAPVPPIQSPEDAPAPSPQPVSAPTAKTVKAAPPPEAPKAQQVSKDQTEPEKPEAKKSVKAKTETKKKTAPKKKAEPKKKAAPKKVTESKKKAPAKRKDTSAKEAAAKTKEKPKKSAPSKAKPKAEQKKETQSADDGQADLFGFPASSTKKDGE